MERRDSNQDLYAASLKMTSNSTSEPSRDRKNRQFVAQKSEFAVNICLTHELRLVLTDIFISSYGSVPPCSKNSTMSAKDSKGG